MCLQYISFLNTPGTQKIGTLLLCVCSSLYSMALGFITTDTMDTRRNGPRTTRKNFLPRFYKQGGQAIDIFRLCKNTVDDWPRADWYSGIVLVGSYKKYFIYLTAQLVHVHACISWCVPETQKKKKATSSHKIPCSLDCATRFCMHQLYPALFPLKTSLRPLFMPSFLPPMFFVSKH